MAINIDSKHNLDQRSRDLWRSLVPLHSKQRQHQHYIRLLRALSRYIVGIFESTVHSYSVF